MATDLNRPVELKLDLEAMATGWAKFADQHLQEALRTKLSAAATNVLLRSIMSRITKTGNSIEKVLTEFMQYGRFYDMGVGRGVPIGAAGTGAFSAARNADGTLKTYRRKPVKWFSRTYYHEVARFKEIYANQFQKDIPVQISDALSSDITLNA